MILHVLFYLMLSKPHQFCVEKKVVFIEVGIADFWTVGALGKVQGEGR
jgi:hypothetical protein